VIPYVVKVIESLRPSGAKKVEIPGRCPVCGFETERTESDVLCPNELTCPAQLKRAIDHFCSRGAMSIEGIGPEWIEQFVDKGFVKSVADLYALTMEDLKSEKLERMGEKLAQKMLDAVEGSRKTTLPRFLNALGIKHVGEATAAALAGHFGGVDPIRKASVEQLEEVRDVGPAVAESIHRFFQDRRNNDVVDALLKKVELRAPEKKGDTLAGQVVVFTGGMESMSRDEAKRLAESHGAKISGTVSKTVTLVVAGPGAGDKLEKATKLGITVIDEAAFLKRIGR